MKKSSRFRRITIRILKTLKTLKTKTLKSSNNPKMIQNLTKAQKPPTPSLFHLQTNPNMILNKMKRSKLSISNMGKANESNIRKDTTKP